MIEKNLINSMKQTKILRDDKQGLCAYCDKPTEYILVDCEDGSSYAFCSWECNTKFLCSKIDSDEPVVWEEIGDVNCCNICGKEDDDMLEDGWRWCDNCFDIAFVLLTSIMKAKTVDDVFMAWSTWRNNFPQRKGNEQSMDNCRYCGKIIWIRRWERQNGRNLGLYCSRECAIEAKRGS